MHCTVRAATMVGRSLTADADGQPERRGTRARGPDREGSNRPPPTTVPLTEEVIRMPGPIQLRLAVVLLLALPLLLAACGGHGGGGY
jgi:hypothetical protein